MSALRHPGSKRILYLQYTNPACYPPLDRSSHLLARQGWKVLFLGTSSLGGDTLQLSPHSNIEVRKQAFCPSGWKQKLHYLGFFFWAMSWVVRWRPQWIYVSDSLAAPLGMLFSYFPGLRVIYHEHDSPGESWPGSMWMRFVLWCRRRLSRRAKLCLLPNAERTKRFSAQLGCRTADCVYNCPSRDEVSPPRPGPSMGTGLRVIYCGSIGSSRLPLGVLSAMAQLPDTMTLCVVGYETVGSRGYLHQLREAASRLGITSRVEYAGELSRGRELHERLDACQVGLCLVPLKSPDINEQWMVGASNKPFEYMARGLALLVPDHPDWRRMYVEPGYGLACDPGDPNSIAETLRWCLEHPLEVHAMGEKGRQRVLEEWNYERQFSPVLRQLTPRDFP